MERICGVFKRALCSGHLDSRLKKLLVVNDRLGNQPIYYAHTQSGFAFASGVRALLVDPALPREIDRIAIAQFLTFDHVLDQRTLLESVN